MKLAPGPGALVAAAFIGPGTVTACTLAGARYGYALVWALVFATLATMVLQDMAARLGASGRRGLGEALSESITQPILRVAALGLVLIAVAVGNAAYESGNLAGGVLGLETVLGDGHRPILIALLAAVAAGVLLMGQYKMLERLLTGLVIVMALAFVVAAVIVRPDVGALLAGLQPKVPAGAELTALALIGTTIVPYNLFLHAAAAKRHWTEPGSLNAARADSAIAIGLGGVISILILGTAAASLSESGGAVRNAADMARALEPAFGAGAQYLVGIGLFAAGLTSAITAPMAAAYVLSEVFPPRDPAKAASRFRLTALAILLIGASVALTGIDAITLIIAAQAANGLLLPVIALFLLVVMNTRAIMGPAVNVKWMNVAGAMVVGVTFALGARGLWRAFETAGLL